MAEVERANGNVASMEKKQRQFERLVGEWRQKCEAVTLELEASQKEARLGQAEVFKLRQQYQESQESLESLSRENKSLAEEIKVIGLGASGWRAFFCVMVWARDG